MKLIVTHFSPDLDAVTSVWLIKRFWKGWDEAEVKFVAAGETYENQMVDSDANIVHVDTGMGKFDHHDRNEDTCAAKLILNVILNGVKDPTNFKKSAGDSSPEFTPQNAGVQNDKKIEGLERLVVLVNDIDHFREVYYPNPTADFYDFGMVGMLDGWKILYGNEPEKIIELALPCLDGIYRQLENKVWAEKLLKEEGIEFKCQWGKAVGVETGNDEILHTGQKQGYVLVIRKDGKKGYVRIKSLPDPKFDLTGIWKRLQKADSQATWFLHASKHMVLNGSTKNPKMKPTSLGLEEIIEIIKKV